MALASNKTVNEWVAETSDEEMLAKLCHIHPDDYTQIVSYLKQNQVIDAIRFLRTGAKDKVVALDGAYYFIRLIQRFENLGEYV